MPNMDTAHSSDANYVPEPKPPPTPEELEQAAEQRRKLEERWEAIDRQNKIWDGRPIDADVVCPDANSRVHEYQLESYGDYDDYSEWYECKFCGHTLEPERVSRLLNYAVIVFEV